MIVGEVVAAADGLWQQPWMLSILSLPVASAASRAVVMGALALVATALAWRRGVPGWPRRAALWTVAGAAIGGALVLVVDVWLAMVPGGLPAPGRWWVVLALAGLGLIGANLVGTRRWRRVGALSAVVPVLLAGALGVNAAYGVLDSVGALLGKPTVPVLDAADLAGPVAASDQPVDAVARTWRPPPGMPAVGRRSTVDIPATTSGFGARPAGLYLPPAALVEHPPVLPVVVMMMGQPGSPDVSFVADVLDAKAAAHGGLAPIVVVADQTGDPFHDTLCMDTSRFGKAETYINTDVVAWVRTHLRVSARRADWVVAGYSNGGLCAARFLALHHSTWGDAIAIAPEEFPGSDHPGRTLAEQFGGDQGAYDAYRLPRVYEGASLPDTWAVFTVSRDDEAHLAGVRRVAAAARKAGAHTSYLEFDGGGHASQTLVQGLDKGFDVLYPRLGLRLS